jgi:phosphate transport system permease protein
MQSSSVQQISGISDAKTRLGDREFDLSYHRRHSEDIIRYVLLACGVVSIFTTIGIVLVLAGNTIGFFQSRAFVIAKAPVAQAEAKAALSSSISPSETVLRIEYLDAVTQFANQQYLQIGDETVRIVARTRTMLTVERGMDGTAAQVHAVGSQIYPMRDAQVKPAEPIAADNITVTLPETFGRLFAAGMEIQIGTEVMKVVGVDGDILQVERGIAGTHISAHPVDQSIAIADYVTLGEFFTNTVWQPQTGEYGIWALLTATLLTSGVALVVAVPLGLGAAIYLSEYAQPRTRNTLKPILEILAGIPTVVYGFFALTFVTPALKNLLFGGSLGSLNMLSAGLTVGVLITPMISSMCEDAISAVPRSLREASYGLGATKLETTIKVIIPAAISGISAAIIVAMSRAVGETMIVLLASGAGPNFTFDLRQSAETMAGHIARISTGDIEYGSLDFTSIFAVGTMLFLTTLGLNMMSNAISRRLRERY